MKEYRNYLEKNNYSIKTITTYLSILNMYKDYLNDIPKIKEKILTKTNPNTIWTHSNTIITFLNFKGEFEKIKELKQLKKPPIPMKFRPVLSKKIIMEITNDLSDYNNVLIRFLFETGLRISELDQIIEIRPKTLILKGKGNKIREVFHNPQTTKYFQGLNVTTKTFRLKIKEYLGEQYTPHSLRRSFATHMLMSGANPKMVMQQLGHSNIETTYRYLNLSPLTNQKIYDKYIKK